MNNLHRVWFVTLLLFLDTSCVNIGVSKKTPILEGVHAVFSYEDVPAGGARGLDDVVLRRLGPYFTAALRAKIREFVRASGRIPRGRTPELNSVGRNNLDLLMTFDPLTRRFDRPDKVDIGGPVYKASTIEVPVTDTFSEDGRVRTRTKAIVTLVLQGNRWLIADVFFPEATPHSTNLSVTLDDLAKNVNEWRANERNPSKWP